MFEEHSEIDGIIVVCLEEWIPYMKEMQYRYRLDKIGKIVPGGETGQLSIYNGLCAAEAVYGIDDNIVLIHDGVRPLINSKTISDNIASVKANGSAITCKLATETVILVDRNAKVCEVPNRAACRMAQAPQSFYLKDILSLHRQAQVDGQTNMIDSCSMMRAYGKSLSVVIGPTENMKITTPDDFYTFRTLYDVRENEQLNGEVKA